MLFFFVIIFVSVHEIKFLFYVKILRKASVRSLHYDTEMQAEFVILIFLKIKKCQKGNYFICLMEHNIKAKFLISKTDLFFGISCQKKIEMCQDKLRIQN